MNLGKIAITVGIQPIELEIDKLLDSIGERKLTAYRWIKEGQALAEAEDKPLIANPDYLGLGEVSNDIKFEVLPEESEDEQSPNHDEPS
jgi:hypothetical protein